MFGQQSTVKLNRIEEDLGTVRLLARVANQILVKNANVNSQFEEDVS